MRSKETTANMTGVARGMAGERQWQDSVARACRRAGRHEGWSSVDKRGLSKPPSVLGMVAQSFRRLRVKRTPEEDDQDDTWARGGDVE